MSTLETLPVPAVAPGLLRTLAANTARGFMTYVLPPLVILGLLLLV